MCLSKAETQTLLTMFGKSSSGYKMRAFIDSRVSRVSSSSWPVSNLNIPAPVGWTNVRVSSIVLNHTVLYCYTFDDDDDDDCGLFFGAF